jgi:hypothetical protein
MTLKDRQRDYFNTQLLKLISDAGAAYSAFVVLDVDTILNDLKNDIRREFDNSQFVK